MNKIDLSEWNLIQCCADEAIDQHKIGKCEMCGIDQIKFADSHTIPKAILRDKLSLKKPNNVRPIYHISGNVIEPLKISFHIMKQLNTKELSDVNNIFQKALRNAGTFNSICVPCEGSIDKYETYLPHILNYQFSQKDLNDLYLKGLLFNKYNIDIATSTGLNIYNKSRLYRDRKDVLLDKNASFVLDKKLELLKSNKLNALVVWDSAEKDISINLRFGYFNLIKYNNPSIGGILKNWGQEIALLIVLIPHNNESRLLLLTDQEACSIIHLRERFNKIPPENVVNHFLNLMISQNFKGLFTPSEYNIENLYKNIFYPENNFKERDKLIRYIKNSYKYNMFQPTVIHN